MNKVGFEAYNIAISDNDGEVPFKLEERSNASKVVGRYRSGDSSIIPVQSLTLDTLSSRLRLNRVDMIRMDVEGHEVNIFRGWKETLRRYRPMVFVEFHGAIGRHATIDLLKSLGQEGYGRAIHVHRIVNEPLIARTEDIHETTVSEMLERFRAGQLLPLDFHLFAWPDNAWTRREGMGLAKPPLAADSAQGGEGRAGTGSVDSSGRHVCGDYDRILFDCRLDDRPPTTDVHGHVAPGGHPLRVFDLRRMVEKVSNAVGGLALRLDLQHLVAGALRTSRSRRPSAGYLEGQLCPHSAFSSSLVSHPNLLAS